IGRRRPLQARSTCRSSTLLFPPACPALPDVENFSVLNGRAPLPELPFPQSLALTPLPSRVPEGQPKGCYRRKLLCLNAARMKKFRTQGTIISAKPLGLLVLKET